MTRRTKGTNKVLKIRFLITIFTLFLIILILYFGGVYYFKDKFYPKTFINDRDVSIMTVTEVEDEIGEEALTYILNIYGNNGEQEAIKGDEFGLVYDIGGSIKEIKNKQTSFLWPFNIIKQKNYQVNISNTYNEKALEERLQKLKIITQVQEQEPVDAKLELIGSSYEIIPDSSGVQINRKKVYNDIIAAIDLQHKEVKLLDYIVTKEANIRADNPDLNSEMADLNKINNLKIIHQFGQEERALDGTMVKTWMIINDQGKVSVKRELVYEYVLGLAKEFNTFGTDRPFTTTDGRQITVKGGDYGWIIDKDKETDYLVQLIEEGKSETREPFYESTANTHDGVDTGSPNTYVEIDFTNQHLYYYLNGNLEVESDIISGDGNNSPTREGTFSMMFKQENHYLKEYKRLVDYFIAFYTDVGLHDATWREGIFGGDIYLTNGSHGCVNMPREKVAAIFSTIPEDTIFYCYY